jgi:hypothetical protein
VLAAAAVAAAVTWAAAPWVDMARHGTIDSRTLEQWRAERRIPRPRRPAAEPDRALTTRCPDEPAPAVSHRRGRGRRPRRTGMVSPPGP